jgi:hypothetical protein
MCGGRFRLPVGRCPARTGQAGDCGDGPGWARSIAYPLVRRPNLEIFHHLPASDAPRLAIIFNQAALEEKAGLIDTCVRLIFKGKPKIIKRKPKTNRKPKKTQCAADYGPAVDGPRAPGR